MHRILALVTILFVISPAAAESTWTYGKYWQGHADRYTGCELRTTFGQSPYTQQFGFRYDGLMKGKLLFDPYNRSFHSEFATEDVHLTFTLEEGTTKSLTLKGKVADKGLSLYSGGTVYSTIGVEFRQEDKLALLLRASKSFTVTISGGLSPDQPWTIPLTNDTKEAYEEVRRCGVRMSLPGEIIRGAGALDKIVPNPCPTDPEAQVGWCMNARPLDHGVYAYDDILSRRYPGIEVPLRRVGLGLIDPWPSELISMMASWSSYVVHGQNEGDKHGSQGSGVAVGPHTILTNCHVVMWQSQTHSISGKADPKQANLVPYDRLYDTVAIAAQDGDGTLWPAKVISHQCQYDLAVVQTVADLYPVLGIRVFDELSKGAKVFAYGAPHGMAGTLTTGVISNLLKSQKYGAQMPNVNLIISSAPVSPGNSGGGLFDEYGNLVGINQAQLPDYAGLYVAIPISELLQVRH